MSQLSQSRVVEDAIDLARCALEDALSDVASMDRSGFALTENDWSFPPDEQLFLARLVAYLKPRHILELGSGISTEVLADATAQQDPPCCISSIEHDPDFRQTTLLKLNAKNAGSRITVQLAPIVLREFGGKLLPVYRLSPDRFASKLPPDLVLIDGPPAALGGREGTLYEILDGSRSGTLVLLDDANRADESAVISRWQDNLGDAIEIKLLPEFSHGMAAILIHQSIRIANLWQHRLRLCRQDLAALISLSDTLIVVDQNKTGSELGRYRRAIPFLERDGEYFGPPVDDATAIRELERLRASGAAFIAFVWPAFWWLEHYARFHDHLCSTYRRVLMNDRLVVFKLQP